MSSATQQQYNSVLMRNFGGFWATKYLTIKNFTNTHYKLRFFYAVDPRIIEAAIISQVGLRWAIHLLLNRCCFTLSHNEKNVLLYNFECFTHYYCDFATNVFQNFKCWINVEFQILRRKMNVQTLQSSLSNRIRHAAC